MRGFIALSSPAVSGPSTVRLDVGRHREPIVRIGPADGLLRILACRLDLRSERGKLMAAPLAHDREGLPVPHQPECDLVWLACLVMARDRRHAKHRPVYAT